MHCRKILFCAPRDTALGGIARCVDHLMTYYEHLHNPGVDIELFRMERTALITPTTDFMKRIILGVKDYVSLLHRFGKRLSGKNDFDIVHVATSGSLGFVKDILMLRKAKSIGLKTILHFHFGRVPEIIESRNWEWHLLKRALQLSDKVIVIDIKSYNALKSIGCDNVCYLPNPIAPSVCDFVKANPGIKRERHTILFAGHVYPTKGVFELVDACRKIPSVKVKLIGAVSDDMRRQLNAGREKTAADNELQIVGQVPFEDVLKEMMSCSVFALPTYTEGFPNVILEGMACGCPIVTTPVGAIPEMLDINNVGGECGVVVPVKNVEKLKEAIERLLDNSEYAEMLGARAKERVVAEYSIDSVWHKTIDIWRKV